MTLELQEDLQYIGNRFEALGLTGKTIVISGATGLLGSFLVKAAAVYNASHPVPVRVIALARNAEKAADLFREYELTAIEFVYCDLSRPLPIAQCDYIIHTASPTGSKYFITCPVEVIETIYLGTRNMLELARSCNVSGMVFLSSMEAFGVVSTEKRISEQELGYIDIQNVRSCYSEGKRMAECLCNAYAKEYNVPVRSARLAQTFGAGVLPGENRVFAQFARSAINGQNVVLHTTGESVGNYVYLRDAVAAILLLLKNGEPGEAYTVVNESATMQIKDMAALVAGHFSGNRSQVIFDIPEGNAYGYAPATRLRLSSKKMNELGWEAEVDLVEMYRRMLPDLT